MECITSTELSSEELFPGGTLEPPFENAFAHGYYAAQQIEPVQLDSLDCAEQFVIGTVISNNALPDAVRRMTERDFAGETHRRFWRAVMRLNEAGIGFDPVDILADLADQDFVIREDGSGTRALLEDFFTRQSFTPRIGMTSNSNETIKQAVIAGMGIAGISRHTIGLELGLGLLKVLPVEGLPLMRTWYVAHRRGMPLMPLHESLRDFIADQGRHIVGRLEKLHRAVAASASPR